MGFARTKKEVTRIFEDVMASKGKIVNVTSGWWESFRKRNPLLILRHAESLSYSRSIASDPTVMNNYFDFLEQTLEEYDLFDRPAQIFNGDETGFPLEHTPWGRNIYALLLLVTRVSLCLHVAMLRGFYLPPLVIFKRKSLNTDMTIGEIPATM